MDLMQMTVNEVLLAAPEVVTILSRLGVDTCCGGGETLADAARSAGLAAEELRAAIEPAGGARREDL